MTAVLDTPATSHARTRDGGPAGLLRGEWVKLRSLRSTWITLAVGLVLMVLLGWLFTATAESGGPGGDGGGGEGGLAGLRHGSAAPAVVVAGPCRAGAGRGRPRP